jgi:ABC-2 type transport system permease protein
LGTLAILGVIARLKLRLSLRYYQRNTGNAIAMAFIMLVLFIAAVAGAVALYFYCHSAGAVARDGAFALVAWILAVVWLTAPLTQFDAQISLDLSGLRLFPLSSASFAAAALLDGLLSPLGLFIAPLGLGLLIALTLSLAELPWLLLSLVLLVIAVLALAQAIVFWSNQLLQSRRFADASIVITIVLFVVLQTANLMLQQYGQLHMPAWLSGMWHTISAVLAPLLQSLFPGLAVRAFSLASAGDFAAAAAAYGLLALQAGLAVWLAGTAARQFYCGELESSAAVRQRGHSVRAGTPRSIFGGVVGALFQRERVYLYRDPLLKLLFIQSLMSMAIVAFMLILNVRRMTGDSMGLPDYSRYIVLGAAVMLSFMESGLLFNKFGYEGPLLVHLLLTPLDRRQLLAAKSAFYLAHFASLNIALIAAIAATLRVPLLYAICAVLIVAGNTALVDLVGHYISILYPFTYRRRGRRLRAVMAQPGCGYMLLYMIVFNVCNLAVAPGSAALIAGTVFGGVAGLAAGAAFYAALLVLAHKYALPHVAGLLVKREPELVALLTKSQQ